MAKATWDQDSHTLARERGEALVLLAVNGKYIPDSLLGGFTLSGPVPEAVARRIMAFAVEEFHKLDEEYKRKLEEAAEEGQSS